MSKKRQRIEREQLQADAAEEAYHRKQPIPDSNSGQFVSLSTQQASRLLYPSPVCFLSTVSPEGKMNVMTLSWLAPANNYGGFVFVVHKTRHTAGCLLSSKEFMLSVASSDQIDLLLACGKVSGSSTDKFNGSIPGLHCAARHIPQGAGNAFSALQDSSDDSGEDAEDQRVGNNKMDGADLVKKIELAPILGTIAHMKCKVLNRSDAADGGHWLVVAQVADAHVSPQYWDGKIFAPVSSDLPGLVAFLGSQQFGEVRHLSRDAITAAAVDEEEGDSAL